MSAIEKSRVSAVWLFQNTEYLVSSSVRDTVLEVQVEETLSTDQWKGRFEAKHIEELTRKTGNFKQFQVFVTMLDSAINKSSECVTLDLLTYSDLEALRDQKNGFAKGPPKHPSPAKGAKQAKAKRYLILTYSVEFDRIHYPLALSYTGEADAASLRETIRRITSELEKYKRLAAQGKRTSALARLQKDYDTLLQEKEALEEALESLQAEHQAVREDGAGKEVRVLQKVIRNLEEEILRERSKHQRYVNKKNEELRALAQEVEELRSSERTLRSRVKNLTNELSVMKRGLRSSSSTLLRRGQSSSSSFKTSPSGVSLRQRSSSQERRALATLTGKSRLRTPSPRGGRQQRFDPTAYVQDKRRKQKESENRFSRLRSPSYRVSRSRSNSAEKPYHSRPPLSSGRAASGSRKLWGTIPEKGTRTRSSSLGSLSGRSSRGSSCASSRQPSLTNLSDIVASPSSIRGSTGKSSASKRKKQADTSQKGSSLHFSTPASTGRNKKTNASLLDHSAEMSEIDARLNALQEFMKRSLESSKTQSKR